MAISKPGLNKAAAAKPVTQAPKSKYADTTSVKAGRDANYFSAGRYLTMIERVEESENQGGTLINPVSQIVLLADGSSRDDSGIDSKSGPLKRVGESVSDVFSKANVSYGANLMAFAVTLSGMSQDEILEAELAVDEETGQPGYKGKFIEEIVSEAQPFAGKVVEINCKVVATKAAKASGKPLMEIPMGKDGLFLKVSYLRVVPYAEVAEMIEAGEIDAKVAARFLPDLAAKVEAEAAEAAGNEEGAAE